VTGRGLAAGLLASIAILGTVHAAWGQPSEADVFVAEGILALEDKKYDEALASFQRALQREPGHVEALYYAGVTLMAQNKAAEAAPLLERARRISPDEMSVAYQLGLAYFGLNRYDEAQVVLEYVFRRDPTLDSLGYYVGYLRYRKGEYQAALQAFRAGRTSDPNIAQLTRFYTGLALNAMGLSRQAAAEVEQALRLQPASPLVGPAERLRQSFAESRDAERRLHASLRLGVFFDDNVNARPEPHRSSDTVNTLRHPENQSWGELASLRLEYDWLKTGPWTSTVGYSFFTTYNNRLPSFNIIDHLGTVTVSRQDVLGSMPLISSVQYAYEYLMLGGTELLQRHAAAIYTTLVEGPQNLTNAIFKAEVKEFVEKGQIDREQFQDGNNYMIGLLHVLRFAQDRHLLKFGYQFDYETAQGSNFAYLGHRFLVGAQYTLPWYNVRLMYDFNLHHRNYQNKHTLFPEDDPGTRRRQDDEYTHLLRVEVPVGRGFTVGADYQGTNQRSNLAPFTYERNIYTLSVTYTY
jgi:tetratricopeptide (TPR) repeat protein